MGYRAYRLQTMQEKNMDGSTVATHDTAVMAVYEMVVITYA